VHVYVYIMRCVMFLFPVWRSADRYSLIPDVRKDRAIFLHLKIRFACYITHTVYIYMYVCMYIYIYIYINSFVC
jgi:hypothetical protein